MQQGGEEGTKTMMQKISLEKKYTMNKYDDHSEVGNNPEKKSSSTTSSSLASCSRMKDQQSFESPAQPGYNQHHCQREAEREEGGGQGFSSNDTTKGETQMYNVQSHTEKEGNILKVEYKATAFEKRHNTESISLQHQDSDCRNLETSDDNLTQEQAEQQGKTREDANHYEAVRLHDTTDASFVSAQISFVDSKINASKTDANKKPIKDNSNEERLDGVWRQHDTRSSSPHRSRLESNSSPPLNNQDISENRRSTDYTAVKPSNNEETIEEASGSQIPIPIRENTSDQVKGRQQKQDRTSSLERQVSYTISYHLKLLSLDTIIHFLTQ